MKIMKVWIICKHDAANLKPTSYEVNRLLEESKKYDIEIETFRPEQFDFVVAREGDPGIFIDSEKRELPDFVLPRMGAGTSYFTLAVLRHIESLGVRVINNPASIEMVKDKLHSQQILAKNNLPVPKSMLVGFPVSIDLVEENIGFPVVVKTLSGSFGSGVFLAEEKRIFEDLMQLVEETNKAANIILQEFISVSKGIDLRVFIIDGKAIACFKRTNTEGGFKANFTAGASVELYEIIPDIERLATQTATALNLDMGGIDLLFDEGNFKICEANSSPGFKALEQISDINIPEKIFNYLRTLLTRQRFG